MENLDRKKLWDLDATSPLHSSAPSMVDDYGNQGSSHTRSNTDASNVGEYATSSTHSQQSTPTADCTGKANSNVTTINHHYSRDTNEVTLIDLSMPPPPPMPLPSASVTNALRRSRAVLGGVGLSGASSSTTSSDGPASFITSSAGGGVFQQPTNTHNNGSISNAAQNYFRTRDHNYTHQPHVPDHPHYPPLQPIQHYNASGRVSASNSTTNLALVKNSRSRSIDAKPSLLRRPESMKLSASSTSSATSSAAAVCLRASSLTRRAALLDKTSGSAPQHFRPNFDLMNAFSSQRVSPVLNANTLPQPTTGTVTTFSNSSSAMLSPHSLSSTNLPTSHAKAAQNAITDELKARNFTVNANARFSSSTLVKAMTNQIVSGKAGGSGDGKENISVPPSITTSSATTTKTLTTVQTVTSNSPTELFKDVPPASFTSAGNEKAFDKPDRKSLLNNNTNEANNSERAAASVKQIIQTIEQQLMLSDNLADADKQLDDLEKALEAGSPTSDSGGNDYPPSLADRQEMLDEVDDDAKAHRESDFHALPAAAASNVYPVSIAAVVSGEPAVLPSNNNGGRSTATSTATTATANHTPQQGQRLLRMIYAEKQRTNAERDKLKRALAERDMYRDHYVSICEGSKWRRTQYEELESRFELLKSENEELRKKLSKHRHKKRRATLEVDSQIATLQQQYAEELQKQKQKRHHERKLRLKQEKEFQLISEQQQQLQQQLQTQPPATNNANHEKCQQAAQLAVKNAVQSLKKNYDAEIEELEIQNVALMLENRDLKHANSALRRGMNDVEQKAAETRRTNAKEVGVAYAPPTSPQLPAKPVSKSLPNSPQKTSAGVQTEKSLLAGGSAPSSPKARDVSTSTTKLNTVGLTAPADNRFAKLAKLSFENSPAVVVSGDQQQSSKLLSSTRLTPPRQPVPPITENNYDEATGFSAIYSDDDENGKDSANRATLRQSFASSTPAARHSQPLLPPQPPPLPPSFNRQMNNNNDNSAVKPSSSSHAQLMRSLSNKHDAHPVGALRQQLLQQRPTATRQIFETSFTTSTPRTLVREVASDDYIRTAYMLASTTNHQHGPPNSNSNTVRRLKPFSAAEAMLSGGATGDDGDDELAGSGEKNETGDEIGGSRRREEILTGTSSTGSEQQQQQVATGGNNNSVSSSATRKRQSRRHLYDLTEDNKAHGDDGSSPFRAKNSNNGSVKKLGAFVMPKGVASVAARRLERKVALVKGGLGGDATLTKVAEVDDIRGEESGRRLKVTTSMPFRSLTSNWNSTALDAANMGTSV